MNTIKTQNESFGFYGSIGLVADADAAWNIAITTICDESGADRHEARAFLDSVWGRHFADTVRDCLDGHGLPEAIREAAARWNGRKLTLRTRRELRIPMSMSYLAGMVYAASEAQAA